MRVIVIGKKGKILPDGYAVVKNVRDDTCEIHLGFGSGYFFVVSKDRIREGNDIVPCNWKLPGEL